MYFTLGVCVFLGCVPVILEGVKHYLFEKTEIDLIIDSIITSL